MLFVCPNVASRMSEDAATQRAPGNAFQRVIDSSHVGIICLQKGCVIIIIIMSRASFEVVVERKKSTPPNTREMKCFNKDGVGGVTILIQTILLSTACAGACVPGVFGFFCRHPHSKVFI